MRSCSSALPALSSLVQGADVPRPLPPCPTRRSSDLATISGERASPTSTASSATASSSPTATRGTPSSIARRTDRPVCRTGSSMRSLRPRSRRRRSGRIRIGRRRLLAVRLGRLLDDLRADAHDARLALVVRRPRFGTKEVAVGRVDLARRSGARRGGALLLDHRLSLRQLRILDALDGYASCHDERCRRTVDAPIL